MIKKSCDNLIYRFYIDKSTALTLSGAIMLDVKDLVSPKRLSRIEAYEELDDFTDF